MAREPMIMLLNGLTASDDEPTASRQEVIDFLNECPVLARAITKKPSAAALGKTTAPSGPAPATPEPEAPAPAQTPRFAPRMPNM